jgi:hypothetical protein
MHCAKMLDVTFNIHLLIDDAMPSVLTDFLGNFCSLIAIGSGWRLASLVRLSFLDRLFLSYISWLALHDYCRRTVAFASLATGPSKKRVLSVVPDE